MTAASSASTAAVGSGFQDWNSSDLGRSYPLDNGVKQGLELTERDRIESTAVAILDEFDLEAGKVDPEGIAIARPEVPKEGSLGSRSQSA